jgi:hypothetical protein
MGVDVQRPNKSFRTLFHLIKNSNFFKSNVQHSNRILFLVGFPVNILLNNQYFVGPPSAAITAFMRLGMLSTKFLILSLGIALHVSQTYLSSWTRFVGFADVYVCFV